VTWRHGANLEHESELIGDPPVLDNLSTLESADVDDVDFDRLAGWCVAHHRTYVDASRPVASPDEIARDRSILYGEGEVRHPSVQCLSDLLDSLRPWVVAALVLDATGCNELLNDGKFTPPNANLNQSAHSRKVIFSSHDVLLF
jgi:hypothetical protein